MTALEDALRAFADRRLAAWTGLPADPSIAEARQILGLDPETQGRGRLGSDGLSADRVWMPDRPLTLWYREATLVLLDDEGPLDDIDLAQLMGAPPQKLDAALGTATMPEGEWVYPSRGLAAIVSSSGATLRLFGFAAMTSDQYQRTIRRDLRARPVPLHTTMRGGTAE